MTEKKRENEGKSMQRWAFLLIKKMSVAFPLYYYFIYYYLFLGAKLLLESVCPLLRHAVTSVTCCLPII